MRRHPAEKHEDCPFLKGDHITNPMVGIMGLKQERRRIEKLLQRRRSSLVELVQVTLKKWRLLEECEQKLQRYFVQYNAFILKGLEKRRRFFNNMQQFQQQARLRGAQNDILRLEVEKSKIVKRLLDIETKKHLIYPNFLRRVVEEGGRYTSIPELTSCFEAIEGSLEKTTGYFNKHMDELEDKRRKLEHLTDDNKPMLLKLDLEINVLSERFDEIKRKNLENEELIMSICSKINDGRKAHEECLANIDNLYDLLCARLDVERGFAKNDFKNQLIYIKSVWRC